jgi:type IV pilus assembly protein PilV
MVIAAFERLPRVQRGVAMLETLVTLMILLVGLLGLVGLQSRVHQSQFESYQRTQALLLLNDMVERIRTNPYAASCYAITGAGGAPYLGADGPGYNGAAVCDLATGTAETRQLAVRGMNEWDALLKGAAETTSATQKGAMVGARGCVSFDAGAGVYTVAVAWQGFSDTAAPQVDCANGLYGRDTQRRVVSTTLRIAKLLN